jgi:HPt (histidine-containing phosphotransfer) domain-containing protein
MASMLMLDRAHFHHMTGGDVALQREVAGLFRDQVAGWDAALAGGADWRAAAHTLKGSARGIGLAKLAAACEAAEAEGESALPQLRAALGEALAELEQFAADAA